uniref:DNA-directed RNA polymerase III subunit RPC3 n=1 Tax=Xenopsylla cheopis TaxID=163159 RepID=A0A6M2DHK0_XENCH
MSVQAGKLVHIILHEHFGETVAEVGFDLFKYGTKPVALICHSTKLPLVDVKHALRILCKYKLVSFAGTSHPEFAEYELLIEKVYLILRYPKYICRMKDKYGDDAEIMIDELLRQGSCTASELILKVHTRVSEQYPETNCDLVSLRNRFVDLVHGNYIARCGIPIVDSPVPSLHLEEHDTFVLPEIDLQELSRLQSENKTKSDNDHIYWVCNFPKFHQDFRDALLVQAMTRRIDACAGEVMRSLLQQMYIRTESFAHQSNAIPFMELKQTCIEIAEDKFPNISLYLEQYLKIFAEESPDFVGKVGDAGGGQYVVNVSKAMEQLVWSAIENFITQKFSSRSARIFRVVRIHKFIEQELIQKRAMIPDKEAKQLTYELVENNFLKIKVIHKGGQGASKNFFLFHIDLLDVVHVILDITEKSLLNSMSRKKLCLEENIRLLQKCERVENLVLTMKIRGDPEEHIQDIEDTITPADHENLARAKKEMVILGYSEIKLDETFFLLKTYLFYAKKDHTVSNCKCCNYIV